MVIRRLTKEDKATYIKNRLTRIDVAMWHVGEMSCHVRQLMDSINADVIQIWGRHNGPEPLTVNVGRCYLEGEM